MPPRVRHYAPVAPPSARDRDDRPHSGAHPASLQVCTHCSSAARRRLQSSHVRHRARARDGPARPQSASRPAAASPGRPGPSPSSTTSTAPRSSRSPRGRTVSPRTFFNYFESKEDAGPRAHRARPVPGDPRRAPAGGRRASGGRGGRGPGVPGVRRLVRRRVRARRPQGGRRPIPPAHAPAGRTDDPGGRGDDRGRPHDPRARPGPGVRTRRRPSRRDAPRHVHDRAPQCREGRRVRPRRRARPPGVRPSATPRPAWPDRPRASSPLVDSRRGPAGEQKTSGHVRGPDVFCSPDGRAHARTRPRARATAS